MVVEPQNLLEGFGLSEFFVEDLLAGKIGDFVADQASDRFFGFRQFAGGQKAGESDVAVAGEGFEGLLGLVLPVLAVERVGHFGAPGRGWDRVGVVAV